MKRLFLILGMTSFVLILSLALFSCEEEKPYVEDTTPDDIPNVLEGVTTADDWAARRAEIRTIMQDNCYGQWRSGETVTYTLADTTLTVKISHGGKNVELTAEVELPTTTAPAGGYPVIFAFGALDGVDGFMGSKGNPREYSLQKGYANISVPTSSIQSTYVPNPDPKKNVAADDNSRTGLFYTLYPYSSAASTQTGVLMAWAWGASKILDALEAGAAAELNINAANTIITGTSRNGKAAAVAGAFEERFKIAVPTSSGAGGAAIYRYKSNGQTYDLSGYFGYNGGGKWTVDGSNPQDLSSVQNDSSGGWFNAKFRTFNEYNEASKLPFDQHFLLALCAASDRHLFMVNGFEWDKWTNPPGFYYAFELTKPVFDLLGIPGNIAVSMHRSRHGLEQEDMVKLIKYANYVFYGIQDLTFDYVENKPKPATWNAFMNDLHITPFSRSVSFSNYKTYQSGKPKIKL